MAIYDPNSNQHSDGRDSEASFHLPKVGGKPGQILYETPFGYMGIWPPIPTIQELFKQYSNLYQFEEGDPEYLIDEEDFKKAVIEFAKLHVQASLDAAAYNAKAKENPSDYGTGEIWVDKKSILSAYPLNLIK